MHVLHVIDGLAIGGAERMLVDTANQSVRDGRRVSVCVTRENCDLAGELLPDIRLYVLGRKRRFDWSAMRQFSRMIEEREVDLLHVHGRSSLSFVVFVKLRHAVHQPIVVQDHLSIEINDRVPAWFRILAPRFLDHYVGVYEPQRTWARRAGISEDRISIVWNSVDLARISSGKPVALRKQFGIHHSVSLGVVIGGIRYEKGLDTLLKALARIKARQQFHVLIVGGVRDPEFMRELEALRQQLALERNVTFLGERDDIPGLLRDVSFAILPSRSESGPLVLIEFLMAGVPFVATRVGEVSEHVARSGVPEFVQPDDAVELAQAIGRLVELSAEERAERIQRGRDVARDLFDIRANISRWYEIYERLLAAG